MKKGKIRFYLGLYIFIIFLYLISNISAKADYNISNSNTWTENLDKFKEDLTDAAKVKNINEIIQKLSPSQRIYIFEKIKASSGIVSSEAKLIGFGSANLKFAQLDKEKDKGKLWIGDGYSWLDFSNLPAGTGSVKYVEGSSADNNRGKFIFYLKNGGEISIESGWVEGNNLFYGKALSIDLKAGEFSLKGTGDKIFLNRNGRINLEGKAEIKIDGKVFSRNDMVLGEGYDYTKAYVTKTGDNEYKASNIKITSDNTIIRTFKGIETDVFLKSGDFSSKSQYVQVYDNNINMVGKGIEVEAIKEYKDAKGNPLYYNIDLNGDELYFRNGAFLIKTSGKQTMISRNPFVKDENGNIKKTYPVELTNLQDTTERIMDDGDFKDRVVKVKNQDETRVCIGKFCTIGGLGFSGYYTEEKPLGTKPAWNQQLISETYVYTDQARMDEFLSKAKSEGWSDENAREKALDFFDQVTSVSTVKKTDLKWKDIKPELDKTIESLGLSPEEAAKVVEFQDTIFKSLGGENTGDKTIIPGETRIITNSEGKKYGIISFNFPNGQKFTHKISGPYFNKQRKENMQKNPYVLSEIIK